MGLIRTKDNRFGTNGLCFTRNADGSWVSNESDSPIIITQEELAVLKKYSGVPIEKFPAGTIRLSARDLNEDNQVSSSKQWLYMVGGGNASDSTFRIDTRNLMGVVRLRSDDLKTTVQLEISSRFDTGSSQWFLRYLIGVGLGMDITEEVDADRNMGWDFLLAYLFVMRMGEVLSVGLLKQYRVFRPNDFNPRGRIDVSRHIRLNWPALKGVAYTKTEPVFDIPINHLLRHAAEKIVRKWPRILSCNKDAKDMLQVLRENTPTWSASRWNAILQDRDCLTPVSQPYFAELYEPLRILARLVLQDEVASIYGAEDSVSGVLFNGADLWEEYLAILLSQLNQKTGTKFAAGEYVHANNRTRSAPIYLYQPRVVGHAGRRRIYPDFRWRMKDVQKKNHEWDCILDAKYKGLVKEDKDTGGDCAPGVSLDDQREMAQYVMATKAKLCILMCPVKESELTDVRTSAGNQDSCWIERRGNHEWFLDGVFFGYESKVIVVSLTIPHSDPTVDTEKSYVEKIKMSERKFLETVEAALVQSFQSE